jgi:tetratricopeptide (TPR) repeat protein
MSLNKKESLRKNPSDKQKRPIFYVIAVLLPFICLLMLEGLLRVSGFGKEYPLFVPSNYSQDYLQANPEVVKRFFHQAKFAPPVGPDTFLFRQNKDTDSIRIVLMGGSTAAGFPYGRFGSPAGMLNQRVKARFPNTHVEIISVAMASINSYALLDFVDEVIEIEPDAVLIYAGHNEYLGVMGVGSVYASNGSHAANLLFLKLKEWRIFQLMQSIYYALFQTPVDVDHSDGSRTVMASVAKEKAIAYDSALFAQGLEQFEQNLIAIQAAFSKAKIPLYISTIASNEMDLPPFSSSSNPDAEQLIDRAKPRSNRRIIQQGVKLLESGDTSADLAYAVAQAMLDENDERAAEFFRLAVDYDLLRFRAPSSFNRIIQKIAEDSSLGSASTFIVDSEATIRNDSSGKIIGAKHMLEHLHPTPRGYFLIADSFYRRLIDNNVFNKLAAKSPTISDLLLTEQAWRNMPLSEVDLLVGNYKISTLTSDYPFTNSKVDVAAPMSDTPIQQIAKRRIEGEPWITTQQELLVILQQQKNTSEAAKAAGLLYDALPKETEAARVASLLYLDINELDFAEFYARRALADSIKNNKTNANYYLTLAEIIFKSGDISGAVSLLDELLKLEPNNTRAITIKNQLNTN